MSSLVRSLASVAFRRAVDKGKAYHFNFFSVDLNEEYSGLYGDCLKDQTEFVRQAMKKIFSLYKYAAVKPTQVILVGHSMGGLVARGVFTLPNFDAHQVNTIYMQATPNLVPVVVPDPELLAYYEKGKRGLSTQVSEHASALVSVVQLLKYYKKLLCYMKMFSYIYISVFIFNNDFALTPQQK